MLWSPRGAGKENAVRGGAARRERLRYVLLGRRMRGGVGALATRALGARPRERIARPGLGETPCGATRAALGISLLCEFLSRCCSSDATIWCSRGRAVPAAACSRRSLQGELSPAAVASPRRRTLGGALAARGGRDGELIVARELDRQPLVRGLTRGRCGFRLLLLLNLLEPLLEVRVRKVRAGVSPAAVGVRAARVCDVPIVDEDDDARGLLLALGSMSLKCTWRKLTSALQSPGLHG